MRKKSLEMGQILKVSREEKSRANKRIGKLEIRTELESLL